MLEVFIQKLSLSSTFYSKLDSFCVVRKCKNTVFISLQTNQMRKNVCNDDNDDKDD